MIQRLIDDVRAATGTAARHSLLVAATAISLFVTTGFLAAAAFVVVLRRYGLVEACLTGAAIFFVVTLLSAGSYVFTRKSKTTRVVQEAKSTAQGFLPDPAMLVTGLQIARAIGFRHVLPIIAIGGLALGALAAKGLAGGQDEADGNADAE